MFDTLFDAQGKPYKRLPYEDAIVKSSNPTATAQQIWDALTEAQQKRKATNHYHGACICYVKINGHTQGTGRDCLLGNIGTMRVRIVYAKCPTIPPQAGPRKQW